MLRLQNFDGMISTMEDITWPIRRDTTKTLAMVIKSLWIYFTSLYISIYLKMPAYVIF